MAKDVFTEVVVLTDPDGLVAPITARERQGRVEFSFGLMKEFERAGRTERTVYLARRHIDGARRLLDKIAEWIDAEEDRVRAKRRRGPAQEGAGT